MSECHAFHVVCCGRRRGILPGGVLICSVCDFDHSGATVIPNERHAKDAPKDATHWMPERGGDRA